MAPTEKKGANRSGLYRKLKGRIGLGWRKQGIKRRLTGRGGLKKVCVTEWFFWWGEGVHAEQQEPVKSAPEEKNKIRPKKSEGEEGVKLVGIFSGRSAGAVRGRRTYSRNSKGGDGRD